MDSYDSVLTLVMGMNVVDGLDGDLQHLAGGTDKFRSASSYFKTKTTLWMTEGIIKMYNSLY